VKKQKKKKKKKREKVREIPPHTHSTALGRTPWSLSLGLSSAHHLLLSLQAACVVSSPHNMPNFNPFGGVTGRTSATLFEIRYVI
jgi:hypothetical protein